MTASLYKKVWEHNEYRSYSPGEFFAQTFVEIASPDSTVIDFGCGSGKGSYTLQALSGQHVIGLDWAENANGEDVEFIVHDLTQPSPVSAEYGFCTDVMEHITPYDVDKVLSNILKAAKRVFFSISTVPDHFGVLVGEALHLTVENFDWWKNKLEEDHSCRIIWSSDQGSNALFYVTAYANGDDFAKIGGLNTEEEQIYKNIKSNLGLQLREVCPHDVQHQHIMLLAGGPSLADHEDEIVEFGKAGGIIVTTNGTYNWLIERGVKPAAQIMIDARPFMSRFVNPVIDTCQYLLSSQCDHEIVKSLPKDQTWLFHSGDSDVVKKAFDDYAEETEEGRSWFPVYGGTTVILRALPLLAMLGFRKIEVFGWDSCLRDGKHHAYAQPENDKGNVIDVVIGGRTFACHPWMIVQANEVGRIVRYILGHIEGFEMEVRGDGLVSHMLQHAAIKAERS